MIAEEAINKLLRDSVNLILEESGFAIRAKQNAPAPDRPYAYVEFMNDQSLGWEQSTYTDRSEDDDLDHKTAGLRQVMYSIGFIKGNTFDNSRKVRTGLVRNSVQEIFNAAGVGLVRRSEVRDISTPLADGYSERAQFDVFLNVVGTDEEITRSILAVDIAAEYQLRGLTYNLNIEVN